MERMANHYIIQHIVQIQANQIIYLKVIHCLVKSQLKRGTNVSIASIYWACIHAERLPLELALNPPHIYFFHSMSPYASPKKAATPLGSSWGQIGTFRIPSSLGRMTSHPLSKFKMENWKFERKCIEKDK